MEKSKFGLLQNKEILGILDGDKDFGMLEIKGMKTDITVSMPYLSGPQLCEISNRFGLPVTYCWGGGSLSRWQYLNNLLEHCIRNGRESSLLAFLFSKEQFVDKLKGNSPEYIDLAYTQIVKKVINEINSVLYFSGNELTKVGKSFSVQEVGSAVTVTTPSLERIDRAYVSDIRQRAYEDLADGHYDSAITKCRSLIEEVFAFVIEKKGENPSDKGNIFNLYAQVKKLCGKKLESDADVKIGDLILGLGKILKPISEIRNMAGDAHGLGSKRIYVEEPQARLFVNSSASIAEFVLSVCEKDAQF